MYIDIYIISIWMRSICFGILQRAHDAMLSFSFVIGKCHDAKVDHHQGLHTEPLCWSPVAVINIPSLLGDKCPLSCLGLKVDIIYELQEVVPCTVDAAGELPHTSMNLVLSMSSDDMSRSSPPPFHGHEYGVVRCCC